MHDGKKIEKKKTVVKEKTLNPVFEETIMFTVPYERIRQTSLVVSVMDYDRMGRNEPIGQIVPREQKRADGGQALERDVCQEQNRRCEVAYIKRFRINNLVGVLFIMFLC